MKTETISIKETLADLLEATQKEIEQFRKEIVEEGAEINKKYSELVDQMKDSLKEMIVLVEHNKAIARETSACLLTKLNALDKQLLLSCGNTAEDLKVHVTILKNTLEETVHDLNKEEISNEAFAGMHDKLQRFRIKLEILKLKLDLGKREMKDVVTAMKQRASSRIEDMKDYAEEVEEGFDANWKKIRHDLKEAYSFIQEAFTSK